MTEQEWLTEESITSLLRALTGVDTDMPVGFSRSVRKERLFAVACSRSELVQDERLRKAIGAVEQCADGLATESEGQKAWEAATEMPPGPQRELALAILSLNLGAVTTAAERLALAHLPGDPLRKVNLSACRKIWRIQTNLLHDIFVNPFRPPPPIDPSILAWNECTIVKLARAIYDERAFDCLPILADALEDAGCDNVDILNHCRQPGDHVRGCWVVDLLLGKK